MSRYGVEQLSEKHTTAHFGAQWRYHRYLAIQEKLFSKGAFGRSQAHFEDGCQRRQGLLPDGNHDDLLRRFGEVSFGLINLRNKLVFKVDGKVHWVFHGDVFDASIQRARWLARLGGKGYDLLIRINRLINGTRRIFGLAPVSFASKVKKSVKGAVRYISDFEDTAIQLAAEQNYDYVICGHIHKPQMREVAANNGSKVTYLNSGDWIEHLTALEYANGNWRIYQYEEDDYAMPNPKLQAPEPETYSLKKEEILPGGLSIAAFDTL